MTYDSFGRKEMKRCHDDGEQKRLLDSHDGDIDQRTDGMGRLSGMETGETGWGLVERCDATCRGNTDGRIYREWGIDI
jgi:hypothetical protein